MFRLLFLYAAGLVLLLGSTNVLALPVEKGSGSSVRPQAAGHGHAHAGASSTPNYHAAAESNERAAKEHDRLKDVYNWQGDKESRKRGEEHRQASDLLRKESMNRSQMASDPSVMPINQLTNYESEENSILSYNNARTAIEQRKASLQYGADGNKVKFDKHHTKFDKYAKKSLLTVPGSIHAEKVDINAANKEAEANFHEGRDTRRAMQSAKKYSGKGELPA